MDKLKINKARQLAKEINLASEFISHEKSGKTTEQAEIALGVGSDSILKTLILYASKEDFFYGAIILGNSKLNIKKLAKLVQVKKLRFANNDQIFNLTGFNIGGVPPLAIKYCKNSFLDKNVLEKQFVIGAGGDEYCGLKFSPKEFVEKTSIVVEELTL